METWRNLLLGIIFFTVTPITLAVSLFSLISLRKNQNRLSALSQNYVRSTQTGVRVFASLPSSFPTISGEAQVQDARAEIVREYLSSYNSPLLPFADLIVATADKYGLDFRLITAIAQKESNLCKIIPPRSNNCWGWGIHSQGTLTFPSYEIGIEEVSRGLKEEYLDKGLKTADEIMTKYTPLSNGSWAYGVKTFMDEMQ